MRSTAQPQLSNSMFNLFLFFTTTTTLHDDTFEPLHTLGRAGKGMASIDICYAVAAYKFGF
jgi:hypothetical protein